MSKTAKQRGKLGMHLFLLRQETGLTLRGIEAASNREVSNAYLSQLETGVAKNPHPFILKSLARVYATRNEPPSKRYQEMMKLAGYLEYSK